MRQTLLEKAKKAWIEKALEKDQKIPGPLQDEEYSGRFNMLLPKGLHRMLAVSAKAEGVSLNQLAMCLIASGLKVPMTR